MAKDKIHDDVVEALQKDGWHIIKEHFSIRYAEFEVSIDIAAERPAVLAEKNGRQILVEIKTFGGRSFINELQDAIGQYILYRNMLTLTNIDYELFLAIDESIYDSYFEKEAANQVVRFNQLNILVVNVKRQEVVKWLKQTEL